MTSIAAEYGQAMYSLACDEGLGDEVLRELDAMKGIVCGEEGFLKLLAAPNLSKEERCGIVDECFAGKVHPYVLSFLKLLTEKGYARHFPACCDAYHALYNEGNGIVTVKAVTAVPLSADQAERLTARLEKMTGKKIALENTVDAACMGGVRLDFDGKRMDDTVRHRLDTVRSLLNNTVL